VQSDNLSLRDEVASLHAVINVLEQDKSDLEIELQAAIIHGDAIEAELALANDQMRGEIAERIRAEARLQRLLSALKEQKSDLELLVHTITEHSDEIDIEQELANEQLRLENERIRLAKEHAEALTRVKTEFVAVVSHEVRTPMNGLLGMARLLLDTALTHEQRDMAETMVSSGRLLLTILDDLLDLSKIEAGRLQVERIELNLVPVVEETLGLMGMRATERGLAVVHAIGADVPAVVMGDPMRLRQVLSNLIGNAAKFTEKGCIALTVGREADAAGVEWLRFDVADTGIGITAEAQTRLFNRYIQAGAWVSRKFGGTGLGLSICRQLVELMGGEIGVTSQPGKGSTFWFRLPLIAAVATGTRVRPARPPGRVLLIEADSLVHRAMASRLTGWGIEVVEATPDTVARDQRPGDVLMVGARLSPALARELTTATGLPTVALAPAGTPAPLDDFPHLVTLPEPVREEALASAFDWLADPTALRPDGGRSLAVAANPGLPPLPLLTILVVEDNAVNRRVAVGMLARQGHTVLTADDGARAIELVRSQPIDLVLMDRHMPVMDGLEAVAAIRALPPPACTVPIAALTAAATPEEVRECLAAGMDDFVAKPIVPEQLTEVIRRLVTARDGARECDFNPAVPAALCELMGDETMAELTKEFFGVAQALLNDAAAAAAMRNAKELAFSAHSMKSAAGQLGLTGVERVCGAIETAVREGRLEDALGLAEQLPSAYVRGRAWLAKG